MVQQKGVELIKSNWILTNTTILNELCFRYEYDYRKRMIMKKVPGTAEPEWMIYDGKDRLVMTKNHFLGAFDKWLVILYDDLNRPIQTGLLLDSYFSNSSFDNILNSARVSNVYPFVTPPTSPTWEMLTQAGFDRYDNLPAGMTLTTALNTTYLRLLICQLRLTRLLIIHRIPSRLIRLLDSQYGQKQKY